VACERLPRDCEPLLRRVLEGELLPRLFVFVRVAIAESSSQTPARAD
jgi:hypothetical protein